MRPLLIIFGVLAILLTPAVILTSKTAAVEIFTHCGSNSTNGAPHVCSDVNTQGGNTGTNNPIVKIIKTATEVVALVVGVAAVIGIIVSGIRMIVAGGDANAVASARSGLAYSLVGIAVAVLAQTLVVFVLDNIH